MTKPYQKSKRVALVSTPWPLYNRPSIQLGALKAYLQSTYPDLRVDARHVYLKLAASLSYKLYQQISERTWLAESIYAALLYPERFEAIETLFKREARSKPLIKKAGLKNITARVKKETEAYISSLKWHEYMLAGFTVSLCQLTSSLYFIKRIKQKFAGLIIAIGGSSFSGTVAKNFFELFPEIDVIINGEGEQPLTRLIGCLKTSPRLDDVPPIDGLITSTSMANGQVYKRFNQLADLNELPTPNYDDYFRLLKSFNPEHAFFPVLPVETSRGCWWHKTTLPDQAGLEKMEKKKRASGCAFCNLNLQWKGYRCKDPARVADDVDHLSSRHHSLSMSIVDNVLPRRSSRELFEKLAKLKKDLDLFAEIRAGIPASELALMRTAGIRELQIGIEALSTSLLKKLNKGTSAIQNLETMRDCEALGVVNTSNLILQFPGSDEQDVAETLRNLEYALPFRPLQTVNFWLGLGSPVWRNPKAYGIQAIFNHPNWSRLFPGEVFRSMAFMILSYRGDRGFQQKLWRPVKKKVASWQKAYRELQQGAQRDPILSYRDGRDFLIIKQRQYQDDAIKHRLVGTSREIYLYCIQRRTLKNICDRFPAFAEDKIIGFLKMMTDKSLMFEERDRYLSLAIPVKVKKED